MKKRLIVILVILAVLMVVAILAGFRIYNKVMRPNVMTPDQKEFSLYIPTGADFGQVKDSLYAQNLIKDQSSF